MTSSSILNPRRILVRGVNWLGDAVMTTPALLRLRERFPEAHIALLTPIKLRDVWLNHPAINETIAIEPGEGVISVGKKLRAKKFDLALLLPNSPRSAVEMWLAGIPRRIGYVRPWRNIFLTQAIALRSAEVKMRKLTKAEILMAKDLPVRSKPEALPVTAHHIFHYVHLTAAIGCNSEPLPPALFVSPEEIFQAEKKLKLASGFEALPPIFGLNPGAEYGPAKRWPLDRFIPAANEIQRLTNCMWLIFGGRNDVAAAAQIESAIRNPRSTINLAGKTALRELMAYLKLCRVLLTNDTGPMHVAAALDTPVVVPFGSTSPELTGPGLPGDARHRLLKSDARCSPCFLRECPIDFRCMNSIGVDRVVEAVVETIKH